MQVGRLKEENEDLKKAIVKLGGSSDLDTNLDEDSRRSELNLNECWKNLAQNSYDCIGKASLISRCYLHIDYFRDSTFPIYYRQAGSTESIRICNFMKEDEEFRTPKER